MQARKEFHFIRFRFIRTAVPEFQAKAFLSNVS